MTEGSSEPEASVPPGADVVEQLADSLTEITERLVEPTDEETLLRILTSSCLRVLSADAAGVMLTDPRGGLAVVAASDERTWLIELLQNQIDQGPCVDCIRTGRIVAETDLLEAESRWPQFTQAALQAGFRAVHAVPLRLDGRDVGGLNLLHNNPTRPPRWQLRTAQAFADLTTLALTREQGIRRAERLVERTLTALNDRVHLAQAVGLVAGTLNIDSDEARALLERHAQQHRQLLRDLATAITTGVLVPADLASTTVPDNPARRS